MLSEKPHEKSCEARSSRKQSTRPFTLIHGRGILAISPRGASSSFTSRIAKFKISSEDISQQNIAFPSVMRIPQTTKTIHRRMDVAGDGG
jgi:hypothetical protein